MQASHQQWSWGSPGRGPPASQKPQNQPGLRPGQASPSSPASLLLPTSPATGWLHFLGLPADLVIVVHADGNKNEAAGQEQQDPQGHEACLGQCGSDHCGGKKSQRGGQGRDRMLDHPFPG